MRNGDWYADKPTDFLGWDITVEAVLGNGLFLVRAVNRGSKEERYVKATEEAVPLSTLERTKRK
jgi:hypothetical protein